MASIDTIGPQIRRLRRDQQLTQATLAKQLGISASYLNLLEHGRRKVTVALLVKLHQVLGVNLGDFAYDHSTQLLADLIGVFDDAAAGTHDLTNQDIRDLVVTLPHVGEVIRTLYATLKRQFEQQEQLQQQSALLTQAPPTGGAFTGVEAIDSRQSRLSIAEGLSQHQAFDALDDILQEHRNHFADLEKVAAQIRVQANWQSIAPLDGAHNPDRVAQSSRTLDELHIPSTDAIGQYLARTLGVPYQFDRMAGITGIGEEEDPQGKQSSHSDPSGIDPGDTYARLMATPLLLPLDESSHRFRMAQRIVVQHGRPVIAMLVSELADRNSTLAALLFRALVNYTAAAVLLPFHDILMATRLVRHDIDLLARLFKASPEQICHRLTTLSVDARSPTSGLPMHFLRVDAAGNVSKRFSVSGMPMPRHGVSCARWLPYRAMRQGAISPQWQAEFHQFTDGECFLVIALPCPKGGYGFGKERAEFTLCFGVHARDAEDFVYADQPLPTVEVGVTCRICPRSPCLQRAAPRFGAAVGWQPTTP
ncbi:MAG: short-chain fatty acyl-CoA regulator family protein [Alphaproteobacteria bacterium]|nr:short-chain fatty acyl-CoA regulator family protein [Alphaproteobacteria bacterium]